MPLFNPPSDRITQIVNAGVPVSLDNLKVQVTSSLGQGFQIGTVNGSIASCTVSGRTTFGTLTGTFLASQNLAFNSTTTMTHPLTWVGQVAGNTMEFDFVDNNTSTLTNKVYQVFIAIGTSFNNNIIEIRRII